MFFGLTYMEKIDTFKVQIFELIGYMLTSAWGLINDPKSYGPFRLLDATSRLITILSENNYSSRDLEEIKDKIEFGKFKVLEDEAEAETFLNELVLYLAELMKKQA
jgi:hypothetical protein